MIMISRYPSESEWSSVLGGDVRQEMLGFLASGGDLTSYSKQMAVFEAHIDRASHVPLTAKVDALRYVGYCVAWTC